MSEDETEVPVDSASPTNRRWVVFGLSCGVSFLLYVHRYLFGLIRPQLRDEYGYTNTELETIGSMFYLGYTFASVPAGMLADFFGSHVFLGTIVIGWSLLLPLLGLQIGVLGLSVVRALFGVAQTGTYPALGQVTQRWFPASERSTAQGWIASFSGRLGGAVAPLLLGVVFVNLAWQFSLIILAAVGVVFGGVFLAVFRTSPEQDPRVNETELALIREGSTASGAETGVMPFKSAFRNFTLRVMVFQQFFNAGADVIYVNTLGSFFTDELDALKDDGSLVLAALLTATPLLGGAIGGATGGYLNRWAVDGFGLRWGRSIVGCAGKILAAAMLVVMMQFSAVLAMGAALFVTKFFTDWTQPTVWGTCTDVGGKYSATVFSIVNMSGNFGALVLPIVAVGPLLDLYTTETLVDGKTVDVTNYTPMFVLMGACYVVSAVCWLLVDCTQSLEDSHGSEEPNAE